MSESFRKPFWEYKSSTKYFHFSNASSNASFHKSLKSHISSSYSFSPRIWIIPFVKPTTIHSRQYLVIELLWCSLHLRSFLIHSFSCCISHRHSHYAHTTQALLDRNKTNGLHAFISHYIKSDHSLFSNNTTITIVIIRDTERVMHNSNSEVINLRNIYKTLVHKSSLQECIQESHSHKSV